MTISIIEIQIKTKFDVPLSHKSTNVIWNCTASQSRDDKWDFKVVVDILYKYFPV